MPSFPVDLSEMPPKIRTAFHDTCTQEAAVEARKATARQRKIAKFYKDHPPRALDSIGAQELAVDPYFANYARLHDKADFYTDRDYRTWLPKRHEEFRVRSTGTKIQAGFSPRFASNYDTIFRKRSPSKTTTTKV